ncbi:AI-2E family transporter [Halomonas sp. DQ26W]|uniref:AI-2E family transporter n=1 Tax=Halomonas sp. DQ26W TaxID=2282311 RepID=UPI000DF7B18A|nr:AI-2E family transporter [Halomonas sp. DQ26W]RDB42848.1 AI-2E family transporter [Halomonas sp. DQ26W]
MDDGFGNLSLFTRQVLIAVGLLALVAILLYFAGQLIDVMLLVFAGILVAVSIDGVSRLFARHLPLPRFWTLSLAFLSIVLLLVGLSSLIGPPLMAQFPQLIQQLPEALEELTAMLLGLPGIEAALDEVEEPGQLINPLLEQVTKIFTSTFGAIASFFLILLIGIYLVLSPSMYLSNALLLFPPALRERWSNVIVTQGRALRLWLLSRLISMLFVGIFISIGLYFMGVPMAGALGLIAGLLTFIPYLGPILGMIPTVLIAFLASPELALYAILLYFVVETLESNVVMPIAAKGVVRLPPAYTVIVQLAGAAVAGLAGVILATPIAVVAVVAVQMLYIEDVLGSKVDVLGK